MIEILKHLNGVEQYVFLQNLLLPVIKDPVRLPKVIQAIMDEVNKTKTS